MSMKLATVSTVLLALQLASVDASVVARRNLNLRQLDPTDTGACETSCNSILNTLNSCDTTDATCVCSANNDNLLQSCLQCTVSAGGDAASAQEILDEYAQNCNALGIQVGDPQLSGGTGAASTIGGGGLPSGGSTDTFGQPSATFSQSGSGSFSTPVLSSSGSFSTALGGNGGVSTLPAVISNGGATSSRSSNPSSPSSSSGSGFNGGNTNPLTGASGAQPKFISASFGGLISMAVAGAIMTFL